MKDLETKEKFVELRAKGWSYDKIAAELKISKQALINWGRERSEEIDNLKAVELEALQEKYKLGTEHRLEAYGEHLKTIRDEIGKRDLKDIPTAKLFELNLAYSTKIKDEEPVIKFRSEQEIEKDKRFNDL